MTCLYISPHLDDVAFSCGGGLLERVKDGKRVVVCTVFTRGEDARADETRRREDQLALAAIGVSHVHLDFEDAPARLGIEPGFRNLVLAPAVRADLVARVERELRRLVGELQPTEVWLPLGVGGHIDHLTVFAARGAAGSLAKYYEDRPYAFVPAFRALRRLQLVGGRLRRPLGPKSIGRQIERGGCGEMLPDSGQAAIIAELALRLAQRYPSDTTELRSRAHLFDEAALSSAATLIQSYRSEVAWLFGKVPVRTVWQRLAAASSRRWFERETRIIERL